MSHDGKLGGMPSFIKRSVAETTHRTLYITGNCREIEITWERQKVCGQNLLWWY